MKQIFLLTFILSTFYCCPQSDTSKEFRNLVKGNYKIQYPSTWTVDTPKTMGVDFFIFSPKENDNDKFRENVNLLVQDLTGQNIDLDEYDKAFILSFTAESNKFDSFLNIAEQILNSFTLTK